MKACFIKSGQWVSQVSFIIFLETIFQVDSKDYFKQTNVVVKTRFSSCSPGSILGPLLFLVYINDVPNELKSSAKLFADGTSFFTIVKHKNGSVNTLNNDLLLISKWVYNWKMLFNPDPSKPAQEVLFSRKKKF